MSVKLISITPEAEKIMLYCARVSSSNQESSDTRLLKYCVNHGHWSVFEMANMCVEVITTRAISAQVIRHRSFSFQEFSGRYAEHTKIHRTGVRRQDTKNRQNSIDDVDENILAWWDVQQCAINSNANTIYQEALKRGIAKECARMILPLSTETKLYMNGTIRSYIHYLASRTHESTQKEHREIALQIKEIFKEQLPIIAAALWEK